MTPYPPSDPGSDTAIRSDPPEGRADMTQCRRGQPNESGRGDAVTIDNLGTKRVFGHPECRFAPSIQHRLSCHGAFLSLNSSEGGGILGVMSLALLPGRSYGKCRLKLGLRSGPRSPSWQICVDVVDSMAYNAISLRGWLWRPRDDLEHAENRARPRV